MSLPAPTFSIPRPTADPDPDIPREMWKAPCSRCPSYWFPEDPESQEYLDHVEATGDVPEHMLFACAFRKGQPRKVCYGAMENVCDALARHREGVGHAG